MNLPGPPCNGPLNYGDLFTFEDFLHAVEATSPQMPYETAMRLFDAKITEGMFAVFAMTDEGKWIYRFVPPEERGYTVVSIYRLGGAL